MKIKLLLIFVFAFLIRLIALNQSLWLDEAITAKVIEQYNYLEILSKFSPFDFHPPFYYLFMKLWSNIFGLSEIGLRFPSVLFSLGAGYIIYLIGGIWSAIFFLFNPLIIYYSQEARMYMMVTFFLTTALYYFLQLVEENINKKVNINKNLILFNVFIFLSLLTFYGSVFLIISFLLYFLFKKKYHYLITTVLAIFGYLILISPLFITQLINSKTSLNMVANWSLVLGKANLKNLFLIPIKFSIGRIDFYPKIIYWGISGLWTSFVFLQVLRDGLKKSKFLFLFIFPIALGFIISFVTPLLQYFRFLYLIPILTILLNFSLFCQADRQPPGLRKPGWIVFAGFVFFSFIYLLIPRFHREDWKSLVKNLPDDKPIYMIISSSDPVRYYNKTIKINDLRFKNKKPTKKEILIIPYTAEIYGVDYENILINNGYKLLKRKVFRGLYLEYWIKPRTTASVVQRQY